MNADKPLLILLHGAGLTTSSWLPQVEALASDSEVVGIDLPAHGQRHRQRFSFEGASAAVAAAIDAAGRTRAVVLGLSLGGYVAMDFAARNPDRVAGLILSGCTIDYSTPRKRFLVTINRVAVALYPKRILAALQARSFRAEYPEYAERIISSGFFLDGFGQALGPLTKRYFPDRLRGFNGPILVLNGEKDKANRVEEARMMSVLPTAELVVLPGAGHICNLDDEDGFNAVVSRFVYRLGSAESPN